MDRREMIHRLYGASGRRFRSRRHQQFLAATGDLANGPLLDVGGTENYWRTRSHCEGATIDLVNTGFPSPVPTGTGVSVILGDGCALPFRDNAYSLVFSNSVIEHVGGPERQTAFALEIRRVGSAHWVQTPARSCPIEPHYLGLFLHWMPKRIQKRTLRWLTVWGWVTRPSSDEVARVVDETRLLSRRQLRILFPESQITTERILGLVPKSYIVTSGLRPIR